MTRIPKMPSHLVFSRGLHQVLHQARGNPIRTGKFYPLISWLARPNPQPTYQDPSLAQYAPFWICSHVSRT